jgi:hypothetical protein
VGKDSDSLNSTPAEAKANAAPAKTETEAAPLEKPAVPPTVPVAAPAKTEEQLKVAADPGTSPAKKGGTRESIASALKGDHLAVVAPRPAMPGVTPQAQLSVDSNSKPRKPEVLVKERKFNVEGPEGAIRLSYDDIDLLRVLNMEPVTGQALTMMPDWLKGLDGKKVRLRGFMYPPYSETDLSEFAFARDNQICCFVKKPKVYDVFGVHLREGELTDYIQNRPFDVVGVFHIVPDATEWPLGGMYRIDDARVIDR